MWMIDLLLILIVNQLVFISSFFFFLASTTAITEASQKISAKFDKCQKRLGKDVTITQGNSPKNALYVSKTLRTLGVGGSQSLYCNHGLCNPTINSTIHWIIPDSVPYVTNDHANFGAHLSSNMSYLTLKSIDVHFKGLYQCYVETSTEICQVINVTVDIDSEFFSNAEHRVILFVTLAGFAVLLVYLVNKIYVLNYLRERVYIPFVPAWIMEADLNVHLRSLKTLENIEKKGLAYISDPTH